MRLIGSLSFLPLLGYLLSEVRSGSCASIGKRDNYDACESVLPEQLRMEIANYTPVVARIVEFGTRGEFAGSTWRELSAFVDEFGPRFTGTKNLEDSIDRVLQRSSAIGLENVHGEAVTVPRWLRGAERATLLSPRIKEMRILGLGYSVGTPERGIVADAVVVASFDELRDRASEVTGKIVVYNEEYVSYPVTVRYRLSGAIEAAKLGAVAALVRTVAPFSLYTPHTGMTSYAENVTKIPTACITHEDASLLGRIAARGQRISLKIVMGAKTLPDTESRNVISEIAGHSEPAKVVVVSGHIDSWDVGEGAMDDGGGAFAAWSSLGLLKRLNLRPRRTIRSIMWTGEEMGIIGASRYIEEHAAERDNIQFAIESDEGTFEPLGLKYDGTLTVRCVLETIMRLLEPLGTKGLVAGAEGPDIRAWLDEGVPGASLWTRNERYFWYHHSEADTMDVEDPVALDRATALLAAVAYVLADMSLDLPRTGQISASNVPLG